MRLVGWLRLAWSRPFMVITCASLIAFMLCPVRASENTKKHLTYGSFDAAFDGIYASEGYEYTLPFKDKVSTGIVRISGTQGTGFYNSRASWTGWAINTYYQTRLIGGITRKFGAAEVKVLAGFDIIDKQTYPSTADPSGGLRVGPTLATSLWWQMLDHAMLNVEASYTTAFNSLTLRVASGITWPEGVSFGPEVILSTQSDSLRIRGGIHLTGVAWEDFSFRLQAGYARNDSGSQGFYAALSSWQRF